MGREGRAPGEELEAAGAPKSLRYRPRSRAKTSGKDGNLRRGRELPAGPRGRVWGNFGWFGGIREGAHPLPGVHQRIKWLARVGTKHGHAPSRDPVGKQNRVGVTQRPGRRGGTSVKAPKMRITASSSQGFAYQPGERQPPPANKVISKIKQNTLSPSPARGPRSPTARSRHTVSPRCRASGAAVHPAGSRFGDPEGKAIGEATP